MQKLQRQSSKKLAQRLLSSNLFTAETENHQSSDWWFFACMVTVGVVADKAAADKLTSSIAFFLNAENIPVDK